jgi:predicted metal-dependent peptidase
MQGAIACTPTVAAITGARLVLLPAALVNVAADHHSALVVHDVAHVDVNGPFLASFPC